MKVIYFHQHFSTPKGSTGNRSYAMARALLKNGHEVTMVCGSYKGGETGLKTEFNKGRREGVVEGIHIIEFDLAYANTDSFIKRSSIFAKFALRSIGLALTHKYDVIFATTTPLTAGIPGIFARHLRRKPFVFEVRDLWPELPKAMGVIKNPIILFLMSCLEWMSYRSAHHCIGLAPGIVEGIVKRGVSPARVSLVPNGCDIEVFQKAQDNPLAAAGVASNDLVAIYGGTHGFANGLMSVIKTATELKERGRDDIKFALVGQGVEKDMLQKEAETRGLTNVFFFDPVPKAELARLFAGADIGLQLLANVPAFYYGTSPNKFFDYISAGLPIITNYPGWVADMVVENACGWSVPPDDPSAFADALEKAYDIKVELSETGQRGLKLAKKDFDRVLLADKFVQTLAVFDPAHKA